VNVYLIGAKNPETRRQVEAAEAADSDYRVAGFLDNDPDKHGLDFVGRPVLGGVDLVPSILARDPEARFVNLITGSTRTRFEVSLAVARHGGRFTNLIHPTVDLSDVRVGVGNYVQDGVILQAGVSIGNNSSIHMGALVGHETTVGSSVFIAHGCSLSGEVLIEDGAFIGTNATVVPRRQVGQWAVVGAGSVIVQDVVAGTTVVGNPARTIRQDADLPPTGDPG
jgi:sugar O-acyltransferase (sialic acid O-acetyltransferase NeuD family)